MTRTICGALAAFTMVLAGPALAEADLAETPVSEDGVQAAENSWTYVAYKQDVDDTDADRVVDYSYYGSMVFTSSTEQLGIVFTCSERHGLGASVGLQPMDFSKIFETSSGRARRRTVEARFDGGEADNSTWIQLPSLGTIEPRESRMRRKIYNAVLKGETLSLNLDARDPVTITFPPVDESFTRWALECPATKPG